MINKEKLIEWAWLNLEFTNSPETWKDTYIIDILNGYNNNCHDVYGHVLTYSEIRSMFYEEED